MEHENPYRPSELTAAAADPQPPPRSITVFGILNLVFGMMGIFGGVMFFIVLGATNVSEIPNPAMDAMKNSAFFNVWTWISTIGGLLASIVLVVSGIALLLKKDIGRRLAIYYAYYALFMAVVGVVLSIIYVYAPMWADLQDSPVAAITVFAGAVIGTALSLLYPALILYFLNKPAVVQALNEGVNPFHA